MSRLKPKLGTATSRTKGKPPAVGKLLHSLDRRVANQEEHAKWFMAAIKELQREQMADKAEIARLRKRVERMDSE